MKIRDTCLSLHIQTMPLTVYTTVNLHMLTSITGDYHYNMYISTVIIMVMWSPKVTYFNVLKFLNTRGSASARAPSSPIFLHWTSSHSRLYIYIYTSRSKTKCIITVFHFMQISSIHQSVNQYTAYFNSSSDLLCCSALARAMAPVEVKEL